MAIRLRLERGGESSEFVFDRAEITVGGEPFHDIVLEEHHAEEVRGAVRVKEERIEFESRICNVRTRLLRDGRAVETIAPDSERRVDVRSGDTLEFDVEPGVVLGVEGFERASEKAPTVEPLDVEGFTEAEEAPPDQLWEAWQRVVEEPTPQTYVETVADAIATAVGERPSLVCLTVSERGGGLRVERASIRAEGDEAGDGRGEWEHREVAGRLSPGDVARLASGGRTTLYSRLDGESSTALLEVDLPGGVDDRDLEQPARWLASLRRLGSSVVLASERRRECRSLAEENRYFRERQRRRYLFKDIVSESAAMQEVYATLNDWVPHGFPVLVAGEAGTGKSLLARALHHLGPRSEEAYLTVNCRELSDEALDLELFGCTESELVDAVAPRKGVFELAEGGTVFLEEVEQLPRSTQEGLLRLLREDEVRRIGGAVGRPVDARLVASTRRDLEALVDRGGFRRDLFVLLREHMLEVPPLRRRQPDILPLARVYLSTFAQRYGRRCRDVSDAVAERFREHRWPGNARELKTAIETAVLNAQDDEVLREEHFGW